MSRSEIRADVVCKDCGRTLRGVQNNVGKWVIRRHKRPDTGRGCLGHYSTSHRPAGIEGPAADRVS